MSHRIIVLDQAEDELIEAQRWYETQRSGLGQEFRSAIDEAMERLLQAPFAASPIINVPASTGARRVLVKRFPYSIVFIDYKDDLWVVAFAHHHRRPGQEQEKRLQKVKEYVRTKRRSGDLTDKEDDFGVCVSPDVVVHERGTDASNLLVVEIKKTGHPLDEKEYDFLKIQSYILEIKYHFGLYLEFGVKDHTGIKKALLFLPDSAQPKDITQVLG